MGKVSGFEFRREYYEIARCLDSRDRLDFYESIMKRVFDDGVSPSKTVSVALELIKAQLDKDAKKTNEPVVIYVR
jgi:hypothetical protein